MSKKNEDILVQQNNLLQTQNNLLEQMNKILQSKPSKVQASIMTEEFVENLYEDEIRSGFLVTSHRKKLWNVQIGLINEFARVCKKHNLRWFAYGGTLLGAVRHEGFIPWDDDVDVAMFRPDYEKLKKILPSEIKFPYFVDNWTNYRLESEDNDNLQSEKNFQFVSKKQEQFCAPRAYFPFWPMIKLRDSRTTMIQYPDRLHVNQGIWIDIFPLDPVPPFYDKEHETNFEMGKDLFITAINPKLFLDKINNTEENVVISDQLKEFLKLNYNQRAIGWENFMAHTFFDSPSVGLFHYHCIGKNISHQTEDFSEIEYAPFEKIEVPIPKGYDRILQTFYGDWRQLVYSHPHVMENFISADISYQEFFKKAAFILRS